MDTDKYLLRFQTYEDYLDSLVNSVDLYYLKRISAAQLIAELGYRSTGETLDRQSFYCRKNTIKNYLDPTYKSYIQDSEFAELTDPLKVELSLRERLNRLGIISTIIFVRVRTKKKSDISGYIDFADRLTNESWQSFFHKKKNLTPLTTDLAYYNWITGMTKLNETKNYQPTIDINQGLIFKNLHDRRIICIDPKLLSQNNTTRLWIKSDEYDHIILYDHFLKSKS
ncbi:hypothetical protein PV326_010962 [Microctonus aethiopoides]|nr:hypothetical protein PV326_010962 [Microctonus aethiopoides]